MSKFMPKPVSVTMALLLAGFGGSGGSACATEDAAAVINPVARQQEVEKVSLSSADHKKFKILDQEFKTGPEVTRACLSCHTEASLQLHKTYHWTWQSSGGIQKGLGKKSVLNNF